MAAPPERGTVGRSFANRLATLRALALLCGMRCGLRLLGYRRMKAAQARLARVRALQAPRPSVPRAMRSIERAKRYLPGEGTCLPDAMAGQVLLARAGFASEVRFGVEAGERERSIRAHAWLVCEGHVVLGEPDPGRYVPLETRRAP